MSINESLNYNEAESKKKKIYIYIYIYIGYIQLAAAVELSILKRNRRHILSPPDTHHLC